MTAEVERFANLKPTTRLAKDLFTPAEIKECQKSANAAERFAAKEAVKKCVTERLAFKQVEIQILQSGKPIVYITNPKLRAKYRFHVNLTPTKQYAEALCLAITIT